MHDAHNSLLNWPTVAVYCRLGWFSKQNLACRFMGWAVAQQQKLCVGR